LRNAPNAHQSIGPNSFSSSKTGVELIDTGDRDEHGMQPLDDLLSSPEQESASEQRYDEDNDDEEQANDHYESGDNEDGDEEGSEDMDIESSALIQAMRATTGLID
jgi:centromere protein C